ncbi:MAG: rrtA [Nevskia sp.]|nr:rrtA [Nevskia sp.]
MIAAEPAPSSPAVWAPLAVLAVFSTALLLGGDGVQHVLRFDRAAIAQGEWWRMLSDNFVHLGGWHLFLNLLSLVLLVLLCPEVLSPLEWCRRVVVIGIGMSLGLYWFVPQLATYVGLSGLIYGLFALGLGRQALRRDKIALAACVFLAARIGWELIVGAPASEQRLVGGSIVGESHLYGVISALIYGAVALVFARYRNAGPQRGGI